LIDRAFLTAHLLTASIEQAEGATLEGIRSWNLDEESEETLFQNVLDLAAKAPVESISQAPKTRTRRIRTFLTSRGPFLDWRLSSVGLSCCACSSAYRWKRGRDCFVCTPTKSISTRAPRSRV